MAGEHDIVGVSLGYIYFPGEAWENPHVLLSVNPSEMKMKY